MTETPPAPQIERAFDLLIRGVDLLDVTGSGASLQRGVDIAIAGGKIAAIAPSIEPERAREVIEGEGRLAHAGFVNCHSHAAMGLFRGVAEDVTVQEWFNDHIWPMETGMDDEDVYWGALLGIAEMIACGVTTFAEHYFKMEHIARAVTDTGIRAELAPTIFSGEGEAEELAASLAFAEAWQGAAGGRIGVMLGPHSPYTCSPDFLRSVAGAARGTGLAVHLHVSETAEQVALCREQSGRTPVGLLQELGLLDGPVLAAHLAHPQDDDLQLLARAGTAVGCCPKTEMKLGAGVTPVGAMRAAGITVGLGSDGAASNNTLDILEAARLTALLEKHERRDPTALPVAEALALATSEGARAVGLEGKVGRLAEGYQADIVLRRFSRPSDRPLHDAAATLLWSAAPADIETVLVAGRPLYRDGAHLTLDLPEVLGQAQARAERLSRQATNRRMAYYPA
ncbi:amidohydrolase family protein [Pseudoroseicyclus tamaricis]|uniref:5-methylthioadenosine/S-adenosylhomocysteine deaminase n=1 Tax=Pseudoroseicyclus tamaricis TaxID=2705421 RepID=A0A6B2JYF5_9RHOB|nr:amidohydrolase [Pseudoroseicyclus tamaricis]NDV01334.1 amidohydrolase [Pseudoroseicyclus tamaricis]